METKELTFEEIAELPKGTILHDEFDEGIRFIIMRGPAAICAYIGIAKDHPAAGHSYDDVPISCHGGLTFAGEGDGKWRSKDYFWYGWDYGHSGDFAFYYLKDDNPPSYAKTGKKWTVKEVKDDSWSAINDFKKIVRICEKASRRPMVKP